MIKFSLKTSQSPRGFDLKRLASAEIEKTISAKAKSAAARHGGVKVRFTRKADGIVRSVEFDGSEAAIQAAQKAIGS